MIEHFFLRSRLITVIRFLKGSEGSQKEGDYNYSLRPLEKRVYIRQTEPQERLGVPNDPEIILEVCMRVYFSKENAIIFVRFSKASVTSKG